MRTFGLCLAFVGFGCAGVLAAEMGPSLAKRQSGVPTLWVASEVILGPTIDLAVSVQKGWVVVAKKYQQAEGDESYGDPLQRPWSDCNIDGGDKVTCGG